MEQVQSQEYRPAMPPGVKVIAWIIVFSAALGLAVLTWAILAARPGEVMFRYLGREYLVGGAMSRIIGLVLLFVASVFSGVVAVSALKGRMWAYWLLLVSSMWHVASVVVGLYVCRIDLMAWLPFVVLWVLIRDFRAFREYAKGRRVRST